LYTTVCVFVISQITFERWLSMAGMAHLARKQQGMSPNQRRILIYCCS
jgi:hypothetical protein